MSIADPILAVLERVITLEGGVAEPLGEHAMSALLPDSVARATEMPEETAFTTRAGAPGARFVSYNSDILKRFDALFERRGALTAVRIAYNGHIKKSGFERLVADQIAFPDGMVRVGEAQARETAYLVCTTAYTAESEDKRQGKVDFIVNAATGAAPVDIGDALVWEADRTPLRTVSRSGMLAPDVLERIMGSLSSRMVREALAPWGERLGRRMHADEERLRAYYRAIEAEIARKIARRALVGEDRAREEARISATARELDRKTAENRARYTVHVTASLHSVLLALLPTVHVRCEFVKKRRRREISVVWNPFTKVIEPLRCERGDEATHRVFFDDDDALVCGHCHDAAAHRGRVIHEV